MKSEDNVVVGGRRILILVFLFLSGMCVLIYQLLWERILSITFGATAFSLSIIVASFMAGLALGSFCFGRLVDKYGNPIRLFASLQIGIGISILVLPLIFVRLQAFYANIYPYFTSSYSLNFVRFALSFLLLLVPTTLIGGTLPIMSKSFVASSEKLGQNIGILYGTDTIGAVMGCFLAGFFLIQILGTKYTMYLGSSINFILAGGALLLNLQKGSPSNRKKKYTLLSRKRAKKQTKIYPTSVIYLVLALFALSGLCGLSYEVLWTRILILFLRSTTYAFAMILIIFLSGLSLGSFIFSRFIDTKKSPLSFLGLIELLIGLLGMGTVFLFSHFPSIVSFLGELTGKESWHQIIVVNFIASFLIIFLPTVFMGATFPIVCKICTRSMEKLGGYIGGIYSLNTIGAIFGGFLTGFIFIPLLGIQRTLAVVTLVSMIIGIVFLGVGLRVRLPSRLAILSMFLPLILVDQFFLFTHDPKILLNAISTKLGSLNKVVFYKEESEGIVSVVEKDNVKRLLINTDIQGDNSYLGQRIQRRQGYLPILLHSKKELKDVLVIGLGTGMTVDALAQHKSIENVESVEIVPSVIEALRCFAHENSRVFENPKVKLYVGDGRSFILSRDKIYDAIVIDLIFPDNAGAGNLYSKDFYELCDKKVHESGLVLQWIPLFQFSPREFKVVVNTFKAAFPYCMLWAGWIDSFRPIVALIGTKGSPLFDFKLVQYKVEKTGIKEQLEKVGLDDVCWVLSYFLMGDSGLSVYSKGAPINTDDHPIIEFSTPRTSWIGAGALNIIDLYENREDVFPLLINIDSQDNIIIKERLNKFYKAQEHYLRGRLFALQGATQNEIREYQRALKFYPEDGDSQYWLEMAKYKLLHNKKFRKK